MELQRGVCILCMDNNKVIKPEDARPFMDLIASVVEEQMNTAEFEKVKDLIKICVICCHKLHVVESKHKQIHKYRESGSCQLCRHEEKNLVSVDTDWKYFVERTEAWDWLRQSKVAKICTGCVFYLDFMFNMKKKLFSKYPQITSQGASPKAASSKAAASPPLARKLKVGGFLKHVRPLRLEPYRVHAEVKRDHKMYRNIAYVDLSQSHTRQARPKIKIRLRPKSRMHKVTFISGGEKRESKSTKKRKLEADQSSPKSKRRKMDIDSKELTPILKNPELKNGDSSSKSRRVRFALKDELIGTKQSSDGSSPEMQEKKSNKNTKTSPKTAKAKKNAAIVNMIMPAKNARRRLLKSRKEDSNESTPTKTKKAAEKKPAKPTPEGTRRSSRRAKSDDSEGTEEKDKTEGVDTEKEEGKVRKEKIKLKEVTVKLERKAGILRRNSSYVETTQDIQEKGPRRLSLPSEEALQETAEDDSEVKELSGESSVDRTTEEEQVDRNSEEANVDRSGDKDQLDRSGEEDQRSDEDDQIDRNGEENQVDRNDDGNQEDRNDEGEHVDRNGKEDQLEHSDEEHQLDRNDEEGQPEPNKDLENFDPNSSDQIPETNADPSDKDKNEESPDACDLPSDDASKDKYGASADAEVSDGKSDDERISPEQPSDRTSEVTDDAPKNYVEPPTWDEANDSEGGEEDSVRDVENILNTLDSSDVNNKAGEVGNVDNATENGLGEDKSHYSTDDSGLDQEVTE